MFFINILCSEGISVNSFSVNLRQTAKPLFFCSGRYGILHIALYNPVFYTVWVVWRQKSRKSILYTIIQGKCINDGDFSQKYRKIKLIYWKNMRNGVAY